MRPQQGVEGQRGFGGGVDTLVSISLTQAKHSPAPEELDYLSKGDENTVFIDFSF